MVGAVVFAFLLGLSIGLYVGRRNAAPGAARVVDVPVVASPVSSSRAPVGPTKRGRKAGLTEADFTPSDDILERLRLAAEGELDPSEIEAPRAVAASASATGATAAAEAEAEAARRAELADKERRVLERLRQLEAQERGEVDDGGSSFS